MMRMIPPTSSTSEMGLFMILMAAGQDQDARNDLRPPWGVTHQEVQRLQESNLLWMAAMCGSEATPEHCPAGAENAPRGGIPIVAEHAAKMFPSANRLLKQTELVYLPTTFLISPTFFWALPSI